MFGRLFHSPIMLSNAYFLYPKVCLFPNHPITLLYRSDFEVFAVIERFSHLQSRHKCLAEPEAWRET